MKNIEALTANTNEKFKHGVPREDSEEEAADKRFREQRMKQVNQLNIKEQHARQMKEQQEAEKMRNSQLSRSSRSHRQIEQSQIDPSIYKNPQADKEVLNLVDSQFGQGFLEFDFGEGKDQVKGQKKQPQPRTEQVQYREEKYKSKNVAHDVRFEDANDMFDSSQVRKNAGDMPPSKSSTEA